VELTEFRHRLSGLMLDKVERPFVCDGSPLQTQMFVVGLNPATALRKNFWCFWDDSRGFDREKFDREYREVRAMKTGNRPRIEAISRAFPRASASRRISTRAPQRPRRCSAVIRRGQKHSNSCSARFSRRLSTSTVPRWCGSLPRRSTLRLTDSMTTLQSGRDSGITPSSSCCGDDALSTPHPHMSLVVHWPPRRERVTSQSSSRRYRVAQTPQVIGGRWTGAITRAA